MWVIRRKSGTISMFWDAYSEEWYWLESVLGRWGVYTNSKRRFRQMGARYRDLRTEIREALCGF